MLQVDPNITHSSIAKQLNRSQPAIGARIKKLTDQGILATQIGVDFSSTEINSYLNLVKIEMTTSKPDEVFEMTKHCPYIINALKMSGEYNILMFMACSSLKRLDVVLDRHFRNQSYVKKIRMDLITSYAKSFIIPVDFSAENFENASDICDVSTCNYCQKVTSLKLK